jgi:hypothetical protein
MMASWAAVAWMDLPMGEPAAFQSKAHGGGEFHEAEWLPD